MSQPAPDPPEYIEQLEQAIWSRAGRKVGPEIHYQCTEHDDHNPSARWHTTKLTWYCDPCGTGGGHVDLARRLDVLPDTRHATPTKRTQRPSRPKASGVKVCTREPAPEHVERGYYRRVETQADQPLPAAFEGRGLKQEHRATLFLAHKGDDGLFPILDPNGRIVGVKKRWANIAQDQSRYMYEVGGSQNPAWCSPCILDTSTLIVVEGELNGMVAWLALNGKSGVMGMAGTGGSIWNEPLKARDVYVYADGDEPGRQARLKWARAAKENKASTVQLIDPLPDGQDFCDFAAETDLDTLGTWLP